MSAETEQATTQFKWLETVLREQGFITGPLTRNDESAIDALLDAMRKRFVVA